LTDIHQLIKNHTEEKSYNDTGRNYFTFILSKNFKRLLSHAAYRKKKFKLEEYSLYNKVVQNLLC